MSDYVKVPEEDIIIGSNVDTNGEPYGGGGDVIGSSALDTMPALRNVLDMFDDIPETLVHREQVFNEGIEAFGTPLGEPSPDSGEQTTIPEGNDAEEAFRVIYQEVNRVKHKLRPKERDTDGDSEPMTQREFESYLFHGLIEEIFMSVKVPKEDIIIGSNGEQSDKQLIVPELQTTVHENNIPLRGAEEPHDLWLNKQARNLLLNARLKKVYDKAKAIRAKDLRKEIAGMIRKYGRHPPENVVQDIEERVTEIETAI